MASYDDARVRTLGPARVDPSGEYVLYWMQLYRRLDHNHALDRALAIAADLGRPLVVYEGLRLDYPWASARLHRFVLEGMADNAAAAAALGVSYWPFVETAPRTGRGLLARLAARACAVVTDDYPTFIVPRQIAALAATSPVPVIAVDGNSVVPLSLLGAPAAAAAHLRPRIHRAFGEAWAHRAAAAPRVTKDVARAVAPPFEPADLRDLDALVARLPIDQSVPPVPAVRGGATAAHAQLDEFIANRLRGVADKRSAPAPPNVSHESDLSPYLHFGHISIEEIVARVLASTGAWTPASLRPDMVGRREGFYSRDADVNSFLDEAITWRDVGFTWHRGRAGDVERLETALPAWALGTLERHAGDARQFVYTPEEWEAGATHDPLWNAAQRELVATGTIQNYLRMLWGKKVIEWSASPAEAYRTLVHLNNKYALDGRDPNSWTGILWCFGLFDRPWAPERRVLGVIRYMSSDNTAKKFKLGPYLDYVASLPTIEAVRGAGAN